MSLSLLNALKPEIAQALDPVPGGTQRKNDPKGNAVVPSWWLREEASLRLTNGLQEGRVVVLDLWGRSHGEVEGMVRSLDGLRDVELLGSGVLTRQSEVVMPEEQNVFRGMVRWDATSFVTLPEEPEL